MAMADTCGIHSFPFFKKLRPPFNNENIVNKRLIDFHPERPENLLRNVYITVSQSHVFHLFFFWGASKATRVGINKPKSLMPYLELRQFN
jgi:hypothetical protein